MLHTFIKVIRGSTRQMMVSNTVGHVLCTALLFFFSSLNFEVYVGYPATSLSLYYNNLQRTSFVKRKTC